MNTTAEVYLWGTRIGIIHQDDHVKNISFLMDRNGTWRLSPAYDITYSYDLTNKWLSAHQMTINGKKAYLLWMKLFANQKSWQKI